MKKRKSNFTTMKYYRMDRQMLGNGAIIYKRSHKLIPIKTGTSLGAEFEGPLLAELDKDLRQRILPTFFTSPGFIAKKEFYHTLNNLGIDNLEAFPVIIKDVIDGTVINDYLFLNVIGLVSCADMNKSKYETLGEDMNVIDKLVINPKKIHGMDLFLVQEDTDCIIISERVYNHLHSKDYPDIFFEELEQK